MRSAKSRSTRQILLSIVLAACGSSSELDGGVDVGDATSLDAGDSDTHLPSDASQDSNDVWDAFDASDSTDAASHPVRYRLGNATSDPLTFCLQDFDGAQERVPSSGALSRGEVTAWAERTRGFVRISWARADVPESDAFCAGELGSTTSIFTYDFEDVTFAVVGVEDEFIDECGPAGETSCLPYGEIMRPIESVAPLFMSSPPRLRVLNGSVRGTDTACFSDSEHSALFGMPTFYESLRPLTPVQVGVDGCLGEALITWPFDPTALADPELYWSAPVAATSATLAIVDGDDGELLAFPWFDAACCD